MVRFALICLVVTGCKSDKTAPAKEGSAAAKEPAASAPPSETVDCHDNAKVEITTSIPNNGFCVWVDSFGDDPDKRCITPGAIFRFYVRDKVDRNRFEMQVDVTNWKLPDGTVLHFNKVDFGKAVGPDGSQLEGMGTALGWRVHVPGEANAVVAPGAGHTMGTMKLAKKPTKQCDPWRIELDFEMHSEAWKTPHTLKGWVELP